MAMAVRLLSALRRRWWRTVAGLLLLGAGAGHVLGVVPLPLLERLDLWWSDLRWALHAPRTLDERIVIIDIDEPSLDRIGHWPWSRDRLATLTTEVIDRQGAALLGFDVLFAEPDGSSGLRHLQQLAQGPLRRNPEFQAQWQSLAPTLDFDARFARALQGRPVVLGYYFTSDRQGHVRGSLPDPTWEPQHLRGKPLASTHWDGYGANLEPLTTAGGSAGFFNAISDEDGVVRSVPLLAEYGGRYYASLAFAMFLRLLDQPAVQPLYATDAAAAPVDVLRAVGLELGGRRMEIPVDAQLAVRVPFRGPGGPQGGSFRYVSAADVLEGRLPARSLEGAVVLVGSTAPGLQDVRVTPAGRVYPGVEVHASLLSGWIDGITVVQPDYAQGADLVQLLVVAGLLALVLPWCTPLVAALLALAALALLLGGNLWLYARQGLALPVATPLVTAVLVYGLHSVAGYFGERRAKRDLAQRFSTYVPPELVEEMVREPERYSMRAQQAELTVLFCDMRGFTALSEGMDPVRLQQLLNRVFTRLTEAIGQHRGTIDKYMGDCVMAFWGAPVPMPDHAARAAAAALDMVQAIEGINAEHQAQHLPAIGVGIGLHTGPMCVGDMGSEIRRSYTVIGDAVNLGSRLEGLCKVYGTSLVASQHTARQAPAIDWMELDRVQVKGKAEAVTILTAASAFAVAGMDAPALWRRFLGYYRAQDWDASEQVLRQLLPLAPWEVLASLFMQRIQTLREHPPGPAWDGTTRFDVK